MKKLSH